MKADRMRAHGGKLRSFHHGQPPSAADDVCENAVEQTSSIPWLERPRAAEYLWDARQYAQEAALPGGVSPEKRRRRGGPQQPHLPDQKSTVAATSGR